MKQSIIIRNSAMDKFKLEDRVTVLGKNISGKIAYIGETHFSKGEWFGIILDEAKGRTNGSIDGKRYFKCPRNYGIFVRSCQLEQEAIRSDLAKSVYPNYLGNYTSVKSSKSQIKTRKDNESKPKKRSPKSEVQPRVNRDLDNLLKKEISQRKEAEEEILKIKDIEVQKTVQDLNTKAATKNAFEKESTTAKDEITALKKKLCKAEEHLKISKKKRGKLDAKLQKLKEVTETAIIEKEIAEEKCEHFELLLDEERNKCRNLEIELDILKQNMHIHSINEEPAVHHVKKLKYIKEVLNNALLNLRDLYHRMQSLVQNYEKVAERNFDEIEGQKTVNKTLEESLYKCQKEIVELSGIADADGIICQPTQKNLNSETKINPLCHVLNDKEDQLEVTEKMQETLQEVNSICSDEIESLELRHKRTQLIFDQMTCLLRDRKEIINKYQEYANILLEKNNNLAEEIGKVRKEKEDAVITAENLKFKIHQDQKKSMSDMINVDNTKFDLQTCKDELNCLSQFMPDDFFVQGGDNCAIQIKLITKKIINKLSLLISLLQSSHETFCSVLKEEESKCLSAETKFLISASKLQGLLIYTTNCLIALMSKNF